MTRRGAKHCMMRLCNIRVWRFRAFENTVLKSLITSLVGLPHGYTLEKIDISKYQDICEWLDTPKKKSTCHWDLACAQRKGFQSGQRAWEDNLHERGE